VAGSDGRDHLEYDLLVTNGLSAPVTLTSIQVVAPDGEALLRLDGDALAEATQPLLGAGPTAEIPGSGTVAVIVDVPVPPERAVDALGHRIAYAVAPDAPLRSAIGSFQIEGPELPVDARPATVIAPPLRGDGWLAANGCCAPASRHRAVRLPVGGARIAKAETFAIDWGRLRDGRLFDGDGARNEDYYGFGAEVLAVAAGTVVAVQDGKPEQAPGQPVAGIERPADYEGNSVTLAIAPGVFAFYAHLQPGSIAVKAGETVAAGQPIGKLGNSGNSTGPHLHFGLLDAPDPLTGDSLPMAFDRWTLAGAIAPEVWAEAATAAAPIPLVPAGEPRSAAATCQLYLDVADFG
jgi:hypothetical protein